MSSSIDLRADDPGADEPAPWPRAAVAAIVLAVATLFGVIHALQGIASGSQTSWASSLSWSLTFSYLLLPVAACAWWLANRFPLRPPHALRNVALHTGAGLALGALHPFALVWVFATALSPRWFMATAESMLPYLHFWYWQAVVIGVLVYAIGLFGAHSLRYYRTLNQGRLRAARLETQLANSNLAALRMQIQPHFLFNALHSISALQLTDGAAARRMTMLLGDFLRMTLRDFDQQRVPLRREIEFLESYLAIEKMRFGDRLGFRFQIPPELAQALVPQLFLQPIVENAVRHGIAPFNAGGEILVRAARRGPQLVVEVTDNGSGSPAAAKLTEGLGLGNTRARLAQMYGREQSMTLLDGQPIGLKVEFVIPFELA